MLALAAAGVLWYVLVRPVPERQGEGVVTGYGFREAERVEREMPHTGRVVETGPRRTAYTLPDRYVYDVLLDGREAPVRFSVPSLGAPAFAVGQRVRVTYRERTIPFAGTRVYVSAMEALPE